MAQTNGETDISLGSIEQRAEKIELQETKADEGAAKEAEKAPIGDKKDEKLPVQEQKDEKLPLSGEKDPNGNKKAPNDPDELRKWNTKVSMELSEVKKQLEALATALNKTQEKQVDWKDLAKDPTKLEEAVKAQKKQLEDSWQQKYDKFQVESYTDITKIEKERRLHDPKYPRWGELLPKIVNMAVTADSRVNFNQHPVIVLDQMYDFATKDNPGAEKPAAAASGAKTYTEAELQAKVAEAAAKAAQEASKGLKAEEQGAGVAGMGKGAPKGKGGVDKEALWKMPLADLKSAIQQASDK